MRFSRAQGATEYLVLLAVVLVIALVGIALLGFFPGTAGEAQARESEIYWEGASPIAIVEMGAKAYDATATIPYLRVRNAGPYRISITKVLANGQSISQVEIGGNGNISGRFVLSPGEEAFFGRTSVWGLPYSQAIWVYLGSSGSSGSTLYAATSICQNSTSSPGTLVLNGFGFEYVQYVEGQQVTKQEIGKPLIIRCT